MNINLAYGQGHLTIESPDARTTVIEPSHTAGLTDEKSAVVQALKSPIGARPLLDLIKPDDRICIVFTDITRATPNERLIPWLLEHLAVGAAREHHPAERSRHASPQHPR